MKAAVLTSGGSMFKRVGTVAGFFCLLAGTQAAWAVDNATVNSVASLANPLDNNGGGARALGMGSAFVGVADDSSALLWNPAGLSGLKKIEIALHHNSALGGIIQETGILGVPLGSLGGLGVSVNYVNAGALPGYDESGAKTDDYSANRYGLGVGWGMQILRGLSGGITAKGTLQSVADNSYSNLAVDLGALWQPMQDLRVGLAYSNLGTSVAGYAQASALRLGASYHLGLGDSNALLLAVSGAWEPQGVSRLQVGAEDLILAVLAVRLGYQGNLADNQTYGLTGLTAGLGVTAQGFGLDYAFLPFGELGAAHRISLSYKFG
jgi:hypothetical protein